MLSIHGWRRLPSSFHLGLRPMRVNRSFHVRIEILSGDRDRQGREQDRSFSVFQRCGCGLMPAGGRETEILKSWGWGRSTWPLTSYRVTSLVTTTNATTPRNAIG
jgi:hypothetical protein